MIVIDEVHTLDIPMIALLRNVYNILYEYSGELYCPLFIFSSATINTEQLNKYFFRTPEPLQNPYLYAKVSGSQNFPVREVYLSKQEYEYIKSRVISEDKLFPFKMIVDYFMKHFYNDLYNSKSSIKTEHGEIQCRDVCFFVPLVSAIEVVKARLKNNIHDKPVFGIGKLTKIDELTEWREHNKGRPRILLVGFARNYSFISDDIMNSPYDAVRDNLQYETKIYISTSIIETGKTIKTLYMCFDSGVDTFTINRPLLKEFYNKIALLQQVPINKNQIIQRVGRLGREAPGIFVHFYMEESYNKLDQYEVPQTINNLCLSNLLLDTIKNRPEFLQLNILQENNYLFPLPIDLLITSTQDLILSGFMTVYGENVMLRNKYNAGDAWFVFVKFLYYIKKLTLFEALLLVYFNKKTLPPIFSISKLYMEMNFKTIDFENPTNDMIDDIQKARNCISRVKYYKNGPFVVIHDRLFPKNEN
jgi:hypothetical protein